MGDFNELMYQHEKKGGNPRPERQLCAFREVVEECHLRDLGYFGPKFTWCNRRAGQHHVSERIGRFLVSSARWNCFPSAGVSHGVVAYFDDLLIWVTLEGVGESHWLKKSFKFEAMWVRETECEEIVLRL